MSEIQKNGREEYYVTCFLGRILKFDFNKNFIGSLYVLEDDKPKNEAYNQVEMESIDFNKTFKTYATENETAFYILTPPIIETLIQLEKRHPGKIGFVFKGNNMYVAINNKVDSFEVKMFKEIDEEMIENFKKDLLAIKDFIEALKLNKNIFKS